MRRLQVMPEVLPTPTKATPNQNVRARTVAHMQRLLATAAAIPLASCTRADTQGSQTVTLPPTASTTAPTASATEEVHGSLLPPPTATATAVATATAPTTGYAVVDPMPAPARCIGLAAQSKSTATLKKRGADWVIDITVTLPAGSTTFAPGSSASTWSGSIVSSSVTSRVGKASVKLAAGATNAYVAFEVTCPAGPGHLSASASFSGAPSATTKLVTSLNDY